MAPLLIAFVKLYRFTVSPLFPPSCRFAPSCSQYAIDALSIHGALKGSALALARIAKCHPFHRGGFDPVPPKNLGFRKSDFGKDLRSSASGE